MQETNDSLKIIAKGGIIIFLGVILSKAFSYVYRIIVSRLGPDEYGLLSIALAIFGILGGLTMLGTEVGLIKFISNYGQKKENIKGVIYDSMKYVLPLSFVLAFLLFICSDYIAINFFNNQDLSILIKILAVFVPINSLRKIFLNSLIGFKQVQYETLSKAITENVSKVIITALFIFLGYGLLGAIFGYVLSILISLAVAYYFLRYKVFNFIDSKISEVYSTKEFYNYSLPLLFSIIVFMVILWTDTLLLGYFRSASEVGIYNAAMPTAQLLFIFPHALMLIFLPVISSIVDFKSHEFTTVFKTVTKWILLVNVLPLAIFIVYPRQILNLVFGTIYSQGNVVLIILSLGFFISYSSLTSNSILLAFNKTRTVFINNLVAAIINLLLNILLIPKYGIIGAAIATAISFVVMAILTLAESYMLTKTLPFKSNIFKIFFSIAIPIMVVNYMVQNYNINTLPYILMTTCLLVISYVLLLILTRTLENDDYFILNSIYKKIGIRISYIDDLFKGLE